MSDRTDLWRYLFIQTACIYEDFPPPMEFSTVVEGEGERDKGKQVKKETEREKNKRKNVVLFLRFGSLKFSFISSRFKYSKFGFIERRKIIIKFRYGTGTSIYFCTV